MKSELNDENSEVNLTLECVLTEAPGSLGIHIMQNTRATLGTPVQ